MTILSIPLTESEQVFFENLYIEKYDEMFYRVYSKFFEGNASEETGWRVNDIIVDAMEAVTRANTVMKIHNVNGYLYKAVYHRACLEMKKMSRWSFISRLPEELHKEDSVVFCQHSSSISALIGVSENWEDMLHTAKGSLTTLQKTVFVAKFENDKEYDEICSIVGKPITERSVSQLKSIACTAKKKVENAIAELVLL